MTLVKLVYIVLFYLLWTGSHVTLYPGVLVFSNFLIPFLKQREYKLSRQGFGEDGHLEWQCLALQNSIEESLFYYRGKE